jgi:ElaB/YqjD/DUF883 family membrane-anchored ribosome-binding protein
MAERDSAAGVQDSAETAQAAGEAAAGDAKAIMRNLADQQMRKLGSKLGGVAQTLHEVAGQIERQNATAGRYAQLAAGKVDRVTDALKERRVDELIWDAEDFARDQPWLFVGGAMAAGFVLARLAKSANTGRASPVRPVGFAPQRAPVPPQGLSETPVTEGGGI